MAINSLGSFDFIRLECGARGASPPVCQQQMIPMQRPGVDGTVLIQTGSKGSPFRIQTVRDVGSIALGNALAVNYQTASRDSALVLVFQGINYSTTYATRYFVLNVEQPQVLRLTGSVGGVMGAGAGALVVAVWTLIPVAYGG